MPIYERKLGTGSSPADAYVRRRLRERSLPKPPNAPKGTLERLPSSLPKEKPILNPAAELYDQVDVTQTSPEEDYTEIILPLLPGDSESMNEALGNLDSSDYGQYGDGDEDDDDDEETTESEPEVKKVYIAEEKTLVEMGFDSTRVENWTVIQQPQKKNLYALMKKMIDHHIKPNVQVHVAHRTFYCHLMVLQCYSEFFMNTNNDRHIILNPDRITPKAFEKIYSWMLSESPMVGRDGIIEVFIGARFLRIQELINQCWLCLDDDKRFHEDLAFMLYLEAKAFDLPRVDDLMLSRISKFFMTLVSSKEFLDMSARTVYTLLASNNVAVNSEIEVFMAAVRWFTRGWDERKRCVAYVLSAVRFGLMPPWFLVTLNKCTDCVEIDRVVACSDVRKSISDAISYTTTNLYYGKNRTEFLAYLEQYNLVEPKQRNWIVDPNCAYHHHTACPNMQFVTYKDFLDYLALLRTKDSNYWRSLQPAKMYNKLNGQCVHSDCRARLAAATEIDPKKKGPAKKLETSSDTYRSTSDRSSTISGIIH